MKKHKTTNRFFRKDLHQVEDQINRREFLTRTSLGLGAVALGSLLGGEKLFAQEAKVPQELANAIPGLGTFPNYMPKVKRVVYLFQSGGPSQFETFDYKPKLEQMFGQDLPASVRKGQRLTSMSASQSSFPIAPSLYSFQQYGESRAWVSELMPYTAEIVDDLCFVKSMYTEQINHDPAITFFQTGHQLPAGLPLVPG